MNKGGAPIGNKNASKGHAWSAAIRHTLDNYEDGSIKKGLALREIAKVVVKRALEGDMYAIREIGDRLDGKPAQAIRGENSGAIILNITTSDANLL